MTTRLALATVLLLLAGSSWAGDLKVGDPVPDVSLRGAGGIEYRTTDFKGQRALVLAWFPLAFTPG